MSKHGWTYKKFEDCLKKFKTPSKIKSSEYYRSGLYPVISQEQEYISGYNNSAEKIFHHDKPVVVFGDHSRVVKYVDFDFIVGADGVKILLVRDELNPRFFYYYIKWIDVQSLGYSRHYKVLKENYIPVPPMGEQEAIVAELDEINSAIDELKLQVADLGTLAQATFYDMFGDPVANPKAWPVKKLGEVCFLKAGKNIKASELSQKPSEGLYPCYGGNGIRGYIAKKSHEGCFPIIGRQGALCGNVVLATGSFYATEHAVVCQPLEELNTIFLFFALKEMNLNQYAKGVAQPGLAVSSITPLFLPIPPMPLQQEFAARVKAIEEAKAELKAQMADMQALLASRMQYWFD